MEIMMSGREMINEYLFYEFGYDLQYDPSAIADDWPFELQMVGTIHSLREWLEVFEFAADGEIYFVLSGDTLAFYPVAEMTLEDLQLQHNGTVWIAHQDPIDLTTSRIGDDLVPSIDERRAAIEDLGASAGVSPRIIEGLYLRNTGTYLAFIEDPRTGTGLMVGNGIEPQAVGFAQASAWRRLALGVGRMLQEGTLKWN
jgi:hypothetical protein